MKTFNIGIIGGGLMGKEAASVISRWLVLNDYPLKVALKNVCDINQNTINWYKQLGFVDILTKDYHELLEQPDIDVVHFALPYHLHLEYYSNLIDIGKDLLAEKSFGVFIMAAQTIKDKVNKSGCFVRCSSEMPFLPGPQRIIKEIQSGSLGKIIKVNTSFFHSNDLDPLKPINWIRQFKYCGDIGVMGDMGIHVLHIPLRLGWRPNRVYARLQKIITQRPNPDGGWSECDTWNNAILSTTFINDNNNDVPMRLEMKRLAPSETNSWFIEVLGTRGGVRYGANDTKTLWLFELINKEQSWKRIDLGFQVSFATVTGSIFELGFSDYFMQMFAAFVAERGGFLDKRFGCVIPEEAVWSHQVFDAALQSHMS